MAGYPGQAAALEGLFFELLIGCGCANRDIALCHDRGIDHPEANLGESSRARGLCLWCGEAGLGENDRREQQAKEG